MGKGKRNKAGRQNRSGRRIVIVDALEVSNRAGMMWMRAGRLDALPTTVILPAELAAAFVRRVRMVADDAEESYWEVLAHAQAMAGGPGPAVEHTMREWVGAQDWASVTDGGNPRMGKDPLSLVSYAGHVGVVVNPPLTPTRAALVIDPQQIHRMMPIFEAAAQSAQRVTDATDSTFTDRMAAVLGYLAFLPWPTAEPLTVSRAEAAGYMDSRYREFLTRSPFIRPASAEFEPNQ